MAIGGDCRSSPISYALSVATREYFRPLLTEKALNYLADLVERRLLHTEGPDFHLVHATPRDPLYEYQSGDADESTWRAGSWRLC